MTGENWEFLKLTYMSESVEEEYINQQLFSILIFPEKLKLFNIFSCFFCENCFHQKLLLIFLEIFLYFTVCMIIIEILLENT